MNITVLSIVIFVIASTEAMSPQTVEVDYSEIANEAENNKKHLLEFLNQTQVRELYRTKYNILLDKITGSTRRIVSGRNTSITAVPWQVSLRHKSRFSCGGSVVTDIWILTAAHCLKRFKTKDLSVRVGSSWKTYGGEMYDVKESYMHPQYDTKHIINDVGLLRLYSTLRFSSRVLPILLAARDSRLPANQMAIVSGWGLMKAKDLSVRVGSSWRTHGGEMYDVKESYMHPQYDTKHLFNDAGLLRLYTTLRFSSRVLPILLAARDSRLPANQMAIVSGWGNMKEKGQFATFLQSASIRTIVMKLCRQSEVDRGIDPASMFCAGSFTQPSPDSCQGDSGGPIVSEGLLIGAVSWGTGCARGNFPGVYTRLSDPGIWDWINGHLTRQDTNVNI